MRRRIAQALLIGYVAFLLAITQLIFWRDHPAPNLVPFRSMARDWREGGWGLVVNFMGNVAAFMPLGILLPMASKTNLGIGRVAAFCVKLSVTIEVLQFLSEKRCADVDDVLLNGLGGVLGYVMGQSAWALLRPEATDCPIGRTSARMAGRSNLC